MQFVFQLCIMRGYYRYRVEEKINELQRTHQEKCSIVNQEFSFACESRIFLGQAKRIIVDRAASAQIETNFIGITFAGEEDVCLEQFCYD